MRVVITGANGQLGKELTRVFSSDTILSYDLPGFDLAGRDVTERIVAAQPDLIVHAGAYTDVDGAEREPDRAMAINAVGTEYVAQAACEANARLVYISTDYVFSGSKQTPYDEQDSPSPINAYGLSKWRGEQVVKSSGARSLIIRTAWLYGASGKNFVKTIMHAVQTQSTLNVVADQRGCPTHAADLADVIRTVALGNVEGILHVTNRGDCTWHEFARAIVRAMGVDIPVVPISTEMAGRLARRPPYSVLGHGRLASLGLALPFWEEAVTRFVYAAQRSIAAC
jgi:dTDP-4-dehydrorhamnose reductase